VRRDTSIKRWENDWRVRQAGSSSNFPIIWAIWICAIGLAALIHLAFLVAWPDFIHEDSAAYLDEVQAILTGHYVDQPGYRPYGVAYILALLSRIFSPNVLVFVTAQHVMSIVTAIFIAATVRFRGRPAHLFTARIPSGGALRTDGSLWQYDRRRDRFSLPDMPGCLHRIGLGVQEMASVPLCRRRWIEPWRRDGLQVGGCGIGDRDPDLACRIGGRPPISIAAFISTGDRWHGNSLPKGAPQRET
jgi:hypothetical protein